MIVEIINEDSMWTYGQISCVSLEKNEIRTNITVSTGRSYATIIYEKSMNEDAVKAYKVLSLNLTLEHIDGKPRACGVSKDGEAISLSGEE